MANAEKRQAYPEGYTDLGLAHGVAGVVGALALAKREGWHVPGLDDALTCLAGWLAMQSIEDGYGIMWPSVVRPDISISPRSARVAWCYGTPGVARALYLAGGALSTPQLQEKALSAFADILRRPRDHWRAVAPNFCHGLSGILQCALHMYNDSDSPQLLPLIEYLVDELFSLYDPGYLFGYRERGEDPVWHDDPCLLSGASGVALTLLAASQSLYPMWDRVFLLS
jgi:hypothetical protein